VLTYAVSVVSLTASVNSVNDRITITENKVPYKSSNKKQKTTVP